jgi:hypothetical protein
MSMGHFSRSELERAFEHYKEVSKQAAESGEWDAWAELFTVDATYVEHQYGRFEGREAIRKWICETMSGYRLMNSFPVEWAIFDEERAWIVFAAWNRMDDLGDGSVHQAASWSLLKYAGDDLWSYEEDIYSPGEFAEMVKGWSAARTRARDRAKESK